MHQNRFVHRLPSESCATPVAGSSLGEAESIELERLLRSLADRHRLRILNMLVRAAAPRGAIGRTFGVVYCGVDIGAASGPAVLGWLLDYGQPQWTFIAIALVLAANVALAYQAAIRRPVADLNAA